MLCSASDLGAFIDSAPTSFHAVAQVVAFLERFGYQHYDNSDDFPTTAGKYVITRSGSVLALDLSEGYDQRKPFRIIGAHVDSPNMRVKRKPDTAMVGIHSLSLEPYGGALLHTWLDRDLILAGRVIVQENQKNTSSKGATLRSYLFTTPAVLKIPSLAIHLSKDRTNPNLNAQEHLNAFFSNRSMSFETWLAEQIDVDPATICSFDVMAADSAPSGLIGADAEFLSAPRLDNLASCYCALRALASFAHTPENEHSVIPVIVFFDHEEVGSRSERGADSDFLISTLERFSALSGVNRGDFLAQLSRSVLCSADMAHATHPHYPDRHEPNHHVLGGAGPVIKINYQLRYATDGMGEAFFVRACDHAGVPYQYFINKADQPCGSTIGPMSAANTGILTVDVGAPQWGMHSIRETMVASDVPMYTQALTSFLQLQ